MMNEHHLKAKREAKEKWDSRVGQCGLFGVLYVSIVGLAAMVVPDGYKTGFIISGIAVGFAWLAFCATMYAIKLHQLDRAWEAREAARDSRG